MALLTESSSRTSSVDLNEAELDQALLARGLQFVTAEPGRYLRLTWGRFCEYFKFWPSSESSLVSNVVRVGSFGLFLPLAVLGLVLARWRARGQRQRLRGRSRRRLCCS